MVKSRKYERERELRTLFDSLNDKYFYNTTFVQSVRLGKFLKDAVNRHVTFGVLKTELTWTNQKIPSPTFVEIILNSYLYLPSVIGMYPFLPETVLFHEMCHAMVLLEDPSTMKNGGDHHGPIWRKWWKLHPLHKEGEEAAADLRVGHTILKEMDHDEEIQEWLKRPDELRFKF